MQISNRPKKKIKNPVTNTAVIVPKIAYIIILPRFLKKYFLEIKIIYFFEGIFFVKVTFSIFNALLIIGF